MSQSYRVCSLTDWGKVACFSWRRAHMPLFFFVFLFFSFLLDKDTNSIWVHLLFKSINSEKTKKDPEPKEETWLRSSICDHLICYSWSRVRRQMKNPPVKLLCLFFPRAASVPASDAAASESWEVFTPEINPVDLSYRQLLFRLMANFLTVWFFRFRFSRSTSASSWIRSTRRSVRLQSEQCAQQTLVRVTSHLSGKSTFIQLAGRTGFLRYFPTNLRASSALAHEGGAESAVHKTGRLQTNGTLNFTSLLRAGSTLWRYRGGKRTTNSISVSCIVSIPSVLLLCTLLHQKHQDKDTRLHKLGHKNVSTKPFF